MSGRNPTSVRAFVVLLLITSMPNVVAQTWQPTPGPYYASVKSWLITPDDHIFAGTYSGGVFRTTDHGDHWLAVNTGFATGSSAYVNDLVLAPNGDIYAATDVDGVFRSINNGDSWIQTNLRNDYIYALAVNAAGDVYAGSHVGEGGIFRSSDHGETWTSINNGIDLAHKWVRSLGINAAGHLFAGIGLSGIYRSTDNGDGWTQINNGLPELCWVNCIRFASNGDIYLGAKLYGEGVWRSTDNGDHWSLLAFEGYDIWGLDFDLTGNILVAAQGGGGHALYRSSDDGESWATVGVSCAGVNFGPQSLAVDGAGRMYTGCGNNIGVVSELILGGAFRSADQGVTWNRINHGVTNIYVACLASDAAGHLFAGTAGTGLFRSLDDGDHWEEIHQGLFIPYVECLAITNEGVMFMGAASQVWTSVDYGDTWEPLHIFPTTVLSITLDALDNIFVCVNSYGIYYSGNGGETWDELNDGLTDLRVYTIAIHPDGAMLAGTRSDGVFRSLDGGENWSPTSLTAIDNRAIVINDHGDVFATAYWLGVHKSIDHGETWIPPTTGMQKVMSLSIGPGGTLYAGTIENAVYYSPDEGDTWIHSTEGLTNWDVRSNFVCNSTGDVFAGSNGGGVFRLPSDCLCGIKGDVDNNGIPNPLDVTYLVNYVYQQLDGRVYPTGWNCPYDLGDLNCTGGVPDPLDVTYLVNYVFKSQDVICDGCSP